MINPDWVLMLSAILFAIGVLGVLLRRDAITILMSVEIMLNAANLVLVSFSRVHNDLSGQVFVFFAMTVAAAEVAVGLAIVIALYRLRHSTDVNEAMDLRDVDRGPVPPVILEGEEQHHHDHDDHGHEDVAAPTPAPEGVA